MEILQMIEYEKKLETIRLRNEEKDMKARAKERLHQEEIDKKHKEQETRRRKEEERKHKLALDEAA